MKGRSGQIIAKLDYLVMLVLNDPFYDVRPDGTVWTKVSKQGHRKDHYPWRPAGYIKEGYVVMKYKSTNLHVHRVVYARFKGPLSEDLVINHKNGIGIDNHPDNLELVTQSVNNIHRFRTLKKPAVMGNHKLTWEEVRVIRDLKSKGYTLTYLAWGFDISKGHVSQIVNNKIWIEGKEYSGGAA